ncbi:3-phosphoshikimate 1-carboxyvinyltransferase [Gangjinia marincola]|uniref:3-phosphoshikimate 1-carboxyvinyltransferase n=1 Tax=Gangjinia marincola TaxID=578463 RepID=A0ABN1MEY2_9FLAO
MSFKKIIQKSKDTQGSLEITGSKSESNRALILSALFKNLSLKNISNSDDANVLQRALLPSSPVIDIHHAGTAMRFLTAYFAVQEGTEVILTGSSRMKERPIKILVDALRSLGANISYLEQEGYPPLKIKGKNITTSKVELSANVSSQYVTALMLIAPSLPQGLEISLLQQITSMPYIEMTLKLLRQIGVKANLIENKITVPHTNTIESQTFIIESDWSSASYFYSIAALSSSADIILSNYKADSLQGDSVLSIYYKHFGVETSFDYRNKRVRLIKKADFRLQRNNAKVDIQLNLVDSPDIAQTIAVTCLGLRISCRLTGLHTLKIKETDRLVALKTEMEKLGAAVDITKDQLTLHRVSNLRKDITIETYNDHRMAMAFAPMALKIPIQINDANVVSKSYPDFWNDLKKLGFQYAEDE